MAVAAFRKTLQMGLGDAMQRLNMLHSKISRGFASPDERKEHALILEALNETKLDLGFDCNLDGVPDTIAIFSESAKTSCCRILPATSSRRSPRRRKKK